MCFILCGSLFNFTLAIVLAPCRPCGRYGIYWPLKSLSISINLFNSLHSLLSVSYCLPSPNPTLKAKLIKSNAYIYCRLAFFFCKCSQSVQCRLRINHSFLVFVYTRKFLCFSFLLTFFKLCLYFFKLFVHCQHNAK